MPEGNLAPLRTDANSLRAQHPIENMNDHLVRHEWPGRLGATMLYSAIRDIAQGKIAACQMHGVFMHDECDTSLSNVIHHEAKLPYIGAENVGHIGRALFETQFSAEARKQYFDEALSNIDQSRAVFGTRRNPMDLIRALADEGSPKGASLLRVGGHPSAFGLVRYQDAGSEIKCHTDAANWDVPDSIEAQQIESQISVVVFLSVADSGGATTIFPTRLSKPQYDLYRLPAPDDYAIDESMLPQRSVTIEPGVGDVVLFEARYPHKVSRTIGRPRYTVSGFIGVCRDGRLVLFS